MNDHPVAFFDSGMGGVTVLVHALKQLPSEHFIYYADTAHVPYGTKPKEEVIRYILEAVEFLRSKNIKALVVACNTATSIAIQQLRERYVDIPVIGMEPAVKPAVEQLSRHRKRVLVCATPLTLHEHKFMELVTRVDTDHIVDSLALHDLVPFAENGEFRDDVILPYLREQLSRFPLDQYETIVLGCTHYPLFYPHFRKVLPDHIRIIDGNEGTVRHLKNKLSENDLLNIHGSGSVNFYSSGDEEKDRSRFDRLQSYYRSFAVQFRGV